MNASRTWLAVPLVLMLAARAGDDETEGDLVISDAEQEAAAPTMTPPAAEMPAMPMTAALQPLQNSGVSGEATVTGRGAQTEVMVRLMGGTANASHPGHIHSGTCDQVGAVVQALQPVMADSTGAGTATSTVDVPANTAMNGQHIVVYHAPGGQPATCAQIPAHMM